MALVTSKLTFIDGSATGPTTIDVTSPDIFGDTTPTAAILTYTSSAGAHQRSYTQGKGKFSGGDTALADPSGGSARRMGGVLYGVGAMAKYGTEATRQFASAIAIQGDITSGTSGASTTSAYRRQSEDYCIIIPTFSSGTTKYAECAGSFILNGIRLTQTPSNWTSGDGDGDILVEVTLLGGTDFSAWSETGTFSSDGAQTVGNIPFRPNFAMTANALPEDLTGNMDTNYDDAFLSHGFLYDDGTDTESRCRTIAVGDANTAQIVRSYISDVYFNHTQSGADNTLYNSCTHTNFDVDGSDGSKFEHNFSVADISVDYGREFGVIYMKFDNEDVYIKDHILPTTTGIKSFSSAKSGGSDGTALQKVFGVGGISTYNTTWRAGQPGSGTFFDWTIQGICAFSLNWFTAHSTNSLITETSPNFTELSLDGLKSIGSYYSSNVYTEQNFYIAREVSRLAPGFSVSGGWKADFTTVKSADPPKTFTVGFGTPKLSPTVFVGNSSGAEIKYVPYQGYARVTTASVGPVLEHKPEFLKSVFFPETLTTSYGTWTTSSATISDVSGGVKVEGTSGFFHSAAVTIPCDHNKQYKLTVTISSDTRTTDPFISISQPISTGGYLDGIGYTADPGTAADDRIYLSENLRVTTALGLEQEYYIFTVGEEIRINFLSVASAPVDYTIETFRLQEFF